MSFAEAFTRLLGHEGTYSNHPSDPGGETMWGITERVARENGYVGAMRDMPRDVAQRIYHARYWIPLKIDQLPPAIQFDVFDAAVNSGVVQAAKWLQLSCGATADGVIGAQTIKRAWQDDAAKISARVNGHRLQFMSALPTWPAFGRGWANRIAKNLIAS